MELWKERGALLKIVIYCCCKVYEQLYAMVEWDALSDG